MPQKLGKVAKKLKNFLALKKRKRPVIWIKEPPQLLSLDYNHRPNPSTCSCQCSCSRRVQPSAPPLPSWLESDMDLGETEPVRMVKCSSSYYHGSSYRQDCSVVRQNRKTRRPGERPGGLFACVVSFTMNVLSCVCPCFRITDAV